MSAVAVEGPRGAHWTAITARMIGDRRRSLLWW